jgi:hypothetical protein
VKRADLRPSDDNVDEPGDSGKPVEAVRSGAWVVAGGLVIGVTAHWLSVACC